ncbi:MAG: hypothetical protein HYY09_08900, partial [Firmicutes bacterium]|nr:hypothetical protein [Bacillota bacterium]
QDLGEGTWTGTAVGGLAGLLAGAGTLAIPGLGPILAIGPLAGILTGAVTGGIGGALVDFGIPETRGKELEKRVKEGKILALVRTEQDKVDKAESIFKDRGAKDVEVHEANGRRGGHH